MTEVPLVPRTVLFGQPERSGPQLSPDGSMLSWLAPADGVGNIWVAPVDRLDDATPVTHCRRDVHHHAWAYDNRHILYLVDTDGDECWRLSRVPATGGEASCLSPPGVQVRVIAHVPDRPGTVLIGLNVRDRRLHDPYRLDIDTGELTKVEENPGFATWIADRQLRLRAAVRPDRSGGRRVLVRAGSGDEWRELLEIPYLDSGGSRVLGFTPDGAGLYLLSSVGAPACRLVRLDVDTGTETVMAADDRYDVTAVWMHPTTGCPRSATLLADRRQTLVLDDTCAADFARLRDAGAGELDVLGADLDDRVWLVGWTRSDGPRSFARYRRQGGGIDELFVERPRLRRYPLAVMRSFRFNARDGLEIPGYVTFPPDRPHRDLPAVVAVHGGPWTRDTWGFNSFAQWFANRGYCCLQVNFRGSTGYGKDFVNAGDGEWGGRMHTDLVDAVGYAVGEGWVDPDRVAISGTSYGGYAALMAGALSPDVFRCAVAVSAPVDLVTLISSIPPYWAPMRATFQRRLGDPGHDDARLGDRSPLHRAGEIRVPVLLVHGVNDPRAPVAQVRRLAASLADGGTPVETLIFEDEGHGLTRPPNLLAFVARAERFLADHLGGRCEEAAGSATAGPVMAVAGDDR